MVDASDPHIDERMEVVNEVLEEIGATQAQILVFNKIDLLDSEQLKELQEKYQNLNPVRVSIKTGENLEQVKDRLIRYFA